MSASNFDLGAATMSETFAPVLVQVEAAGVFSAADIKKLRGIVTSSDLKQETLRQVTDPETGELVDLLQ